MDEFEKQALKVVVRLEALHGDCVGKYRRPFDINKFEMGRAAIIADALRAAHEAGRVEGIEEAAKECDDHATYWTSKFGSTALGHVSAAEDCADTIRALLAGKGEK